MRLSPHPAQHLRSFSTNIMERLFPFRWHSQKFIRVSSHFANMPSKSCEGTACAFAGYFVRHVPLYSVLPQARGLRHQSSSWCTWLSHAQTTKPHPPLLSALGFRPGSPPSYCPPPFTSWEKLPVFSREDSDGTRQVACSSPYPVRSLRLPSLWTLGRSGLPRSPLPPSWCAWVHTLTARV